MPELLIRDLALSGSAVITALFEPKSIQLAMALDESLDVVQDV